MAKNGENLEIFVEVGRGRGVNVHGHDYITCGSVRSVTQLDDIEYVPFATEPGISLVILTPTKILQRNLNRSTFVV